MVEFKDINGDKQSFDEKGHFNIAFNADCMEFLRNCPDNAFDLCVTDPPYGGGSTEDAYHGAIVGRFGGRFEKYHLCENVAIKATRTGGTWATKYKGTEISAHRSSKPGGSHKNYDTGADIRHWDVAPPPEYFEELFRVSRNQIIWGGNYFALPPTRCFLIWRKLSISENFTMAMCEYAWTSFNDNAKLFEHVPQGKDRFHPCLPKGEMVSFNGEWKKIEEVQIGDKNIFGRVAAITQHDADKIIEIITNEGNATKATWNHPFLVLRGKEVAWINAEQLRAGDKIVCTKQQEKGICDIAQTESGCEWNTTSCGRNATAKFPKGCKSITLTATRPITTFPICNLSRPLNINGYTRVATLKTAFGTSLAAVAANIRQLPTKIGILTKKRDGLLRHIADRAMSKKSLRNVECEWQTVGSVKTIREKTRVYNLSIDGIPAFETKVGISHNTQKPVALYEWIFSRYAKEGDKILDTHLGSGSSRIAAYNAGLDFVGYEIDKTYFDLEEERFKKHTAQIQFFNLGKVEE